MKTEKILYKMLTENTGKHFMDSGGENGRHWQHNQKKTFKDFKKENYFSFEISKYNHGGELEIIGTKSLFHHLNETLTYSSDETKALNDWINENPYHWADNREGRSNVWGDVAEFMEKEYDSKVNCLYTYNEENILSQDIQFLYLGDIYERDLIALSIHNGADARGGLTDYKMFRIVDWDCFLDWRRFTITTEIKPDKPTLFKKLPKPETNYYWDYDYSSYSHAESNYPKDLTEFDLTENETENLKGKILFKNNKYYLHGKHELVA